MDASTGSAATEFQGSYDAVCGRDGRFGQEVTDLLIASGMKPRRISPASPWQNGVAERWVGSCRRELLDYVVVFNEAHLIRLRFSFGDGQGNCPTAQ